MASRSEGAAGRDGVCLGGTCWKNQDKGAENKPEAGQKLPGRSNGAGGPRTEQTGRRDIGPGWDGLSRTCQAE